MNKSERVFYLKKNLRLMSWIQLAGILGIVLVAMLGWALIILFRVGGDFRLELALITAVVMLALSPTLLLNISHLVSRLKISDKGLDYLYWPFYHIRCSWAEVHSITRRKEIVVEADVLLLRTATEVGFSITMLMRKRMGLDSQYFIPLNVWDGWPSGEFAETRRHYAPFLIS